MKRKTSTLIVMVCFIFCFNYFAQASTVEARNLLITKFEKVYLQLAPGDTARTSVALRLADLLAERARTDAMEELNRGCVNCTAGMKDRIRAVDLYEEALPKVKKTQRGKILAQLGHLLELTNKEKEAQELYQKIINEESDAEFVAEAKISLAEMSFKNRNYQQALKYYSQVLDIQESKRKSLAAYKQAWCLFNLGKTQESIDKLVVILKTPSLLTKISEGVVSVDPHYKAEVAKDLSTFVAKKGASLEDIKMVYELSPDSSRITNVSYLANELERLGQTSLAISAYDFVLQKEEDP
ncbi:MAG: tetratricopeptide repeat protein, partial [Bdellovibrionales bacterium]|nr:tetratricopeptide repeat protein [Bdellovibrionales bacterium]